MQVGEFVTNDGLINFFANEIMNYVATSNSQIYMPCDLLGRCSPDVIKIYGTLVYFLPMITVIKLL